MLHDWCAYQSKNVRQQHAPLRKEYKDADFVLRLGFQPNVFAAIREGPWRSVPKINPRLCNTCALSAARAGS